MSLFYRKHLHNWMPLDLAGKKIKCLQCGEIRKH